MLGVDSSRRQRTLLKFVVVLVLQLGDFWSLECWIIFLLARQCVLDLGLDLLGDECAQNPPAIRHPHAL